jgi:AraC-like DNA-binding protein
VPGERTRRIDARTDAASAGASLPSGRPRPVGKPLVRAGVLAGYTELAQAARLDVRAMLERAGLHRLNLEDPDLWIPSDAVATLLERSARQAGAEDFGLRMAAGRRLSHLGPIGLVMRDEPTVRHALTTVERYTVLLNAPLLLAIEEDRGIAVLRAQFVGAYESGRRQLTELAIGVLCRTLASLLGDAWSPEMVCFTHAAPLGRTMHRELFRTRVMFDREFDGVVLRSRDLDRPIPAADPVMARYARRFLESLVGDAQLSMRTRVRQLVMVMLPSGQCTGEQVARHLGVDRRTVNRHLAAQGESFSSIVGQVRSDLVQLHLENQRRSLTEIAHLAGFANLSAFSRWFAARFGASPSRWRQRRHDVAT